MIPSFSEVNEFLTQNVTIKSQSNIATGGGNYRTEWTAVATVKGLKVQLNGTEIDQFQKKKIVVNSKVYLKKGSIANTNNKLVVGGKSLDIKEVRNLMNANEFIICYCHE